MLPTPPASPKPYGASDPEDRLGLVLGGQIRLTDILGVGAYGTVYRARDVFDANKQYAVKALNKHGLDPRQKQFQDREIDLHFRTSHHPNVVSMDKIYDGPDCIFVILEFCPQGDLFSRITEEGDYIGKDYKAKHVFLQILDAVRHCHSHGIYHRDLKPENILVQDDGWTVKLADFGLATQDQFTSDFGCGSTFYMSPECQQSNPKPFACYASAPNDIWSLGVILVNLTCGRNPWKRASTEDSTFRAFVKDRNFLQTILPISHGLNNVLKRIFDLDPQRRISLHELREAILRCDYLGQEPTACDLPLTPQYTPEQKPVDSPLDSFNQGLEPVPNMDPLPVQQYPAFSDMPFNSPQPSMAPINLPTPPSSTAGSPRQSPHTFQAKPAVHAVGAPFAIQTGFLPPMPQWSRCTNLMPSFAQQACWRSARVF